MHTPDALPVSVVIATLGGKALEETIGHLRRADASPNEILVCIPEGVDYEACLAEDSVLRVVRTPVRGQVAQRAYGLALVRNPYVMQLDDDILFDDQGFQRLLDTCIGVSPGTAIAPLLKNCESGQYLTRYTRDFRGFLQSAIAFLVCGAPWGAARMGKISPAGIPYGIDREYCNGQSLVESEWLPGGCVICRKADLVTESYFPFPGKAFSEDVIHSVLWRRKGVRLLVATDISCCTFIAPMPATSATIRADYRARAHVIAMNGGSLTRCRLWFSLFIAKQWLRKHLLGRC